MLLLPERLVVVLAIASVPCGFATAAERSRPDGDEQAKTSAAMQASFDVGVKRLPARFEGNTVEWVLRFRTLAPPHVSETRAAYVERRRAFRSEVFAFVLDSHDAKYDRAAEELTVTVRPSTVHFGVPVGGYYTVFDVHRRKLAVTTRAGPSRRSRTDRPKAAERGAVLSTRRVWKQTQIVTNEGLYDGSSQPLVFRLKMTRTLAEQRSNIRVALVCLPRLEQFRPAGDTTVPEATGAEVRADGSLQFSDQSITYFVALRCNLLQVWVFDFRTGDVFGRFTPQGVLVPRE